MESLPNNHIMFPMSTFVNAGGINLLLQHATYVTLTPASIDPHYPQNYFVDIRFRFNVKTGLPYFSHTECGIDVLPTPSKLGSQLSDEHTAMDATVLSAEHGGPVYVPDECWIARTAPLSSILEEEATERVHDMREQYTSPVPTITSVRDVVRAVEVHPEEADPYMDREFCFDSPLQPATVVSDGPYEEPNSVAGVADRNRSRRPMLTHVLDEEVANSQTGSGTSDRTNKKKEHEGEVADEDIMTVTKHPFDDPELLLIKPNPVQPSVPREEPAPPPVGRVGNRPNCEVDRDESMARGLLRRTSNLARSIVRMLSSNGRLAARGLGSDGNGDTNDDANDYGGVMKRRSLFARRPPTDDIGRTTGMIRPDSMETNQEPYRVHKRRSLIFGRRYKS